MGIERKFEIRIQEKLDELEIVNEVIRDIAVVLRNGMEDEPIKEKYGDLRIDGKHIIHNTGTDLENLTISNSIINIMNKMGLLDYVRIKSDGSLHGTKRRTYLVFTKEAEDLYKQLKIVNYSKIDYILPPDND